MIVSQRAARLVGPKWTTLLVCCCLCESVWAQSSKPANPLRHRTVAAAEATPAAAAEPVASEEPIESQPMSRVNRARLRVRRSVRPASYGLFARRRQNEAVQVSATEPQLVSEDPVLEDASLIADDMVVQGIHHTVPQKGIQQKGIQQKGIQQKGPQKFPGGITLGKGGACCDGAGCSVCLALPRISFENVEVFGGVQGFTGPKNRGQTGSFGFDVGFNWGMESPLSNGSLGMQFGLRSAHSNFSGAQFTADDRNQLFLTGGFFRRVDWGLQGGLVIDYLSDNWYTDTELAQLRGELSWVYPHGHELGFWFTAHTESDIAVSTFSGGVASVSETWQATDLYAFYYRKRVCNAAGRFYAGFTNDSDGLIGADLRLPLSDKWAIESGFAYLIPEQARTGLSGGGHEQESWNLGINVVWYPGCMDECDYFRPLLGVADNGSFMVDRR